MFITDLYRLRCLWIVAHCVWHESMHCHYAITIDLFNFRSDFLERGSKKIDEKVGKKVCMEEWTASDNASNGSNVYCARRIECTASSSLMKQTIIKFSESDKTVELVWWPTKFWSNADQAKRRDREEKNEHIGSRITKPNTQNEIITNQSHKNNNY